MRILRKWYYKIFPCRACHGYGCISTNLGYSLGSTFCPVCNGHLLGSQQARKQRIIEANVRSSDGRLIEVI